MPREFGGSELGSGFLGEPIGSRLQVVGERRERQVRHAVTLDLHEGEPIRFGPDERDPRDVLLEVEADTALPGGFDPGRYVLPRPQRMRAEDGRLLAFGRLYDADTNRTIHEGQITGVNISEQITLELQGFSKLLDADSTAREIFYDRDLSHWSGPSLRRQAQLLASLTPGDAAVAWDTALGASALQCELQSPWDAGSALPRIEGWYDALGIDLEALDYAWEKSATIDDTDTHYSWAAGGSDDDIATNRAATSNLRAAGPGSGTLTFSDVKRFLDVQLSYNAANGANGNKYDIDWTLLAAIGAHGLPIQGSVATPATGRGIFASDILAYVVATWAPLLNFTTGLNGSIEPTGFIVPQSAFMEETTARAMVESLLTYGGSARLPLDYGVYDDREFFCKSPGTYGRTWEGRREWAALSDDEGPDSTKLLNGTKVIYDDGSGKKRSVGPPGSRSDIETTDLVDTSPNNPANRDGQRYWSVYDAGITSDEGALLTGQLLLYDARQQPWRGSVTLPGEIRTIDGRRYPSGMARSGDRIVITDDTDNSERRVVNTTYDGSNVVASCGQPPDHLDVLLARRDVVLVGRL
jgi:hypothetical protein